MGRHDRDDPDRHHRSGHYSEEKYSLQELKSRARREVDASRGSRSDGNHHRSRDHRDGRHGRRGHSRSASPARHRNRPEQRRSISRSPNRNKQQSRGRRDQNERNDFRPDRQFNNNKNDLQRRKYDDNGQQNRNANENSGTSGDGNDGKPEEPPPEIKPNFELTGNLSKDTNMFNGVLVKYHEPAEAKKPRKHWRFYPFKGDTPLDFIPLHRQSAYLFGRDRRVADVPVDHPSCSKQHAVLQFRSVEVERPDGTKTRATRPYVIDLESGNGTYVNNKQIEARRYVELMERDVVKFGFSSREYVLLHDQSQGEEEQRDSDIET